MSGTTKNSKLLQYIYERAESIKQQNGNKFLTANHFFAAVLQYCSSGYQSFEFDEEESNALRALVSDILSSEKVMQYIETLSSKKDEFMDDFLFKKNVDSSERMAKKSGKDMVSADMLIKSIFEAPTPEIESIIKCEKGNKTDSGMSAESIQRAVDLFKKTSGTKEEENAQIVEPEVEAPKVETVKKAETPKEYIAQLTEKVKAMQKKLSSVVFGQDNAISIFASGYFQSELKSITDKKNKRPRATYLFAGPPGVGKTFLAEQAAEMLGLPFLRFDMSEYSERDALMDLLGTNKSFKDAKEGSLTSFVKSNPKCVLLFDEIEKANIAVIHLFLQVLDAGRLKDSNSAREVDFSNTIIIFTTNAGRKIYEDSVTPNLAGISRKTILKALETDVDPKTGLGSFPAAICSRFATGNVVMFNHMEAHSLRKIAEKEIMSNAKAFEEETGIKCTISDDVYSCVLFAEGGHADARTVKSRASSFFSAELYELFRLVSNGDNNSDIEKIENINITVELPKDEQILRLFKDDSKGCVLSFGDTSVCEKLNEVVAERDYKNIIVSSAEEAINILEKQDVKVVFCDLCYGNNADAVELNIEDVESDGRTLLKYVCEKTDVPLYILADGQNSYSVEEEFSLTKEGARGFVDVALTDELSDKIEDILTRIHQQQSMIDLAKSNKLVVYETSQVLKNDGTTAEIELYDVALETSVDAEDSGNILSNVSKPDVKFSDIIGADGAKSELKYFIDYLKNPKAFASKGLGVPKGVLFYGPPGTGKTMLAKAVAGETNVTFICAEGNQFLKKYVGEGEETVHNLFATARKYAPSIIFIDEIDAIAKERTGGEHSHDSILTAFLAEMDGFKTDAKRPVFVLAATNFEVEPGTSKSLDSAILRRFDRHIYIELPNKKARIEYINMQIGKKPIFKISDEEIENIAVRSTGMSLANLASVFEFAMRIAIRENKDCIDDAIFEEAFETFNYGEERKWDISELKKTAYHEAGHAFLCWHSGETPSYLTIVARGNHGGYMLHGDNENRGSYTKTMLLNRIRTALGGRASELVFFGEEEGMTTGASGDLRTATSVAKHMVCNYGMDSNFGLAVVQENELNDGVLGQKIRDVVNEILANELNNAKTILSQNRKAIDAIVDALLQKNHLSAYEIDEIFSNNANKGDC